MMAKLIKSIIFTPNLLIEMIESNQKIENKSFTFKKILQLVLMLALAGVLLYFSFKEVKWDGFIENLKKCNYSWILFSMFLGFLGFFFRAIRWRLLLLPLNSNITKREAYDGVMIGYLTNFAFPRAGELARCGVIAKTKKASFEGALGTVVLERSFDMLCLLFFVILILVFKWNEFGSFMSKELFEPLIGKFSNSFLWIIFGAIILSILIISYFVHKNKESLLKKKFFSKIYNILKGLGAGILSAFKMKNKGLFFLFTAMLWTTYWLTSYATILAFPSVGHLSIVDALFLMVVGGLGWVVPVQGGLGAYHFIVSLALYAVYSIPQTEGVVFATISHESQAFMMIVLGAISLISINISSKKSKLNK
jgi:conserved hypothetical protein